jgi:hypothetical protein
MKNCKKCNVEFTPSKGLVSYCSLACRNSRVQTEDIKLKKSITAKSSEKVLKANKLSGKLKLQNNAKEVLCTICNRLFTVPKHRKVKYHKECWNNQSGGYKEGSGRGKSGWYKGYWCDSSYELAWVVYNLDHNIPFERNKKRYEYEWEGKTRQYIPDFVLGDQVVEIKGYMTEQVKIKAQAVPNLKILLKEDIQKELEYVKRIYGKDYIQMYKKQ